MPKYIKLESAIETTWMILRGLGYKREENTQLARTVLDVFATVPAVETAHVEKKRGVIWKDDVLEILSERNAAWDAYQKVKDLPAADVYEAERVDRYCLRCQEEYREKTSGKWIEEEDGYDHVFYSCSVCGAGICTIDETPIEYGWKYCPECGSKMEELVRLHEDEEDEDDD